ncbi:hypothetical protein [Intestinibacillus sp. Marseille-P6563]|uniref:hypothetical protein n=1 Tax=Intestinibacillus sp. Marseille-P6563 TaxID=2364792 RepID=UPI000F0570A8|nr:hypothetical protein [Intestinibacillus sp. Marseille-P6563]
MKLFSRRFGIFAGVAILAFLLLATSYLGSLSTSTETNNRPFSISISAPEIIEESGQRFEDNALVPTGTIDRRLELTISITNMTQTNFQDVRFSASLNAEVKPFIASHILTFESDPMPVTTVEKATQNADSSQLLISGFVHTWSMLLTTAEDLEYSGKQPEELPDALKSVTISVYWDGGSQEQTFPLHLS